MTMPRRRRAPSGWSDFIKAEPRALQRSSAHLPRGSGGSQHRTTARWRAAMSRRAASSAAAPHHSAFQSHAHLRCFVYYLWYLVFVWPRTRRLPASAAGDCHAHLPLVHHLLAHRVPAPHLRPTRYNPNSSVNRLSAVTAAAGPLHDYAGAGRGPAALRNDDGSFCLVS